MPIQDVETFPVYRRNTYGGVSSMFDPKKYSGRFGIYGIIEDDEIVYIGEGNIYTRLHRHFAKWTSMWTKWIQEINYHEHLDDHEYRYFVIPDDHHELTLPARKRRLKSLQDALIAQCDPRDNSLKKRVRELFDNTLMMTPQSVIFKTDDFSEGFENTAAF